MNLIGKRFGKLTVIAASDKPSASRHKNYLCRCDCGKEVIETSSNLKNGNRVSCGCSRFKYHSTLADMLNSFDLSMSELSRQCGIPLSTLIFIKSGKRAMSEKNASLLEAFSDTRNKHCPKSTWLFASQEAIRERELSKYSE